jgi:hypothetical protein
VTDVQRAVVDQLLQDSALRTQLEQLFAHKVRTTTSDRD